MSNIIETIKKAKQLGFANEVSIRDIREHYGEDIANKLVELFTSYVKNRVDEYFTINHSNSILTITDEIDENGLPIVKYYASYTYYRSWFSFENYISGRINKTLDRLEEILQMYIDKNKDAIKIFDGKIMQNEETKYFNNEYDNMPSIDYDYDENRIRMKQDNTNLIDWNKVAEICKKYGFSYTIINSTFGGNDCEFIAYKKMGIDATQYMEWYKNKDYDKIREEDKKAKDTFLKLHDCIHELDEETKLIFRTGWAGNCGLFGSNDVRRQTYSFGSHLIGWESITDKWSPLIHDTNKKLSKGVYALMSTYFIKN